MKAFGILAVCAVMVLAAGCAGLNPLTPITEAVSAHDEQVTREIIDQYSSQRNPTAKDLAEQVIVPPPPGMVGFGVNVAAIIRNRIGYARAWADNKMAMLKAHGTAAMKAGAIGGGGFAIYKFGESQGWFGGSDNGGDKKTTSESKQDSTTTGDGGVAVHAEPGSTVIINQNKDGTQANGNSGQ